MEHCYNVYQLLSRRKGSSQSVNQKTSDDEMKEKKLTIKRHILLRNYLQAAKNESQKKSRTYKSCKKDSDSLFSVELNGKGGLNAKKKKSRHTRYMSLKAYILPRLLYGLGILPRNITSGCYVNRTSKTIPH